MIRQGQWIGVHCSEKTTYPEFPKKLVVFLKTETNKAVSRHINIVDDKGKLEIRQRNLVLLDIKDKDDKHINQFQSRWPKLLCL